MCIRAGHIAVMILAAARATVAEARQELENERRARARESWDRGILDLDRRRQENVGPRSTHNGG